MVGKGGFEPPKSETTDLQSAPFGRLGISPHDKIYDTTKQSCCQHVICSKSIEYVQKALIHRILQYYIVQYPLKYIQSSKQKMCSKMPV